MRHQFTIMPPPPHRPGLALVGAAMFMAAIAGAVLIVACGDHTPRTAEAKTVEAATVTPSTATPESSAPVISGPVSYERADSAFNDRRYSEAVGLFSAYTASKPENPWGHYMLGLSAWKAGDRETAERELNKTIELDSTHVKARLNLSRVLIESGRANEALVPLQTVLTLDSTSTSAYRLLGRAHDALGETDSAVDAYKRAIVLDGHDAWAINNLAMVFVEQGRYDEALKPLARAVELDSSVARFGNNLGVALERTGHFTAAAEAYKQALGIDSTYAKASVSLTRVTGLKEDPTLPAVDLGALSRAFVADVESWRK
jgi:Flp pilus assembly protein TadD